MVHITRAFNPMRSMLCQNSDKYYATEVVVRFCKPMCYPWSAGRRFVQYKKYATHDMKREGGIAMMNYYGVMWSG